MTSIFFLNKNWFSWNTNIRLHQFIFKEKFNTKGNIIPNRKSQQKRSSNSWQKKEIFPDAKMHLCFYFHTSFVYISMSFRVLLYPTFIDNVTISSQFADFRVYANNKWDFTISCVKYPTHSPPTPPKKNRAELQIFLKYFGTFIKSGK